MDPLSAIAVASFVKELIGLCLSIRTSLAKVAESRRRLHHVIEDIQYSMGKFEDLLKQHILLPRPSQDFINVLQGLQMELISIADDCQRIVQMPSNGWKANTIEKLKAWYNRAAIEARVLRIEKRLSVCYSHFSIFSMARVEQRIIHMENLLAENHEHRAHLHRFDICFKHLLLDPGHTGGYQQLNFDTNIEKQYTHLQFTTALNSIDQKVSKMPAEFTTSTTRKAADSLAPPLFIVSGYASPKQILINVLLLGEKNASQAYLGVHDTALYLNRLCQLYFQLIQFEIYPGSEVILQRLVQVLQRLASAYGSGYLRLLMFGRFWFSHVLMAQGKYRQALEVTNVSLDACRSHPSLQAIFLYVLLMNYSYCLAQIEPLSQRFPSTRPALIMQQ